MSDNWNDFNDLEPNLKKQNQEIRDALNNQIYNVLKYLMPNGKVKGEQFLIGNIHGDKGESLKIEINGDKIGQWYDFATEEGGDLIKLWAICHNINHQNQFNKVIQSIQNWLGTHKPKIHKNHVTKYDYYNNNGELIACVFRYQYENSKEFRPWDVINRKDSFPTPRPLFNIPNINLNKDIIIVEGEKCAQALNNIGFCSTTLMGGANSPLNKTDFSPLKDKNIIIWPDNDEPGSNYAAKIKDYLLKENITQNVNVLNIPNTLPEKWDAYNAVNSKINITKFLKDNLSQDDKIINAFSLNELVSDTSDMPDDLIEPRILTPAGLLLFGGAPKVGKTDFILELIIHLAQAKPFLGMKAPRPLKILYIQTEIDYHYLRERIQNMNINKDTLTKIGENVLITPKHYLSINDDNVQNITENIKLNLSKHNIKHNEIDIIVIDPLRNVYQGNANDNSDMIKFLKLVENIRDNINPNAGIILVHHTKKITKDQLKEDPFQAFSGASALRGYYSSGIIMYYPDENNSLRQIVFELRNGKPINTKNVDKINGKWVEIDVSSQRIVNQDYGKKLDAERRRKHDVILEIIFEQAQQGTLYTLNSFCKAFEGKNGLGGEDAIKRRMKVLINKGYIKFNKDYLKNNSKYGALCVENMTLNQIDEDTGIITPIPILPTHYRIKSTGAFVEVEDPNTWVYPDEDYTPPPIKFCALQTRFK